MNKKFSLHLLLSVAAATASTAIIASDVRVTGKINEVEIKNDATAFVTTSKDVVAKVNQPASTVVVVDTTSSKDAAKAVVAAASQSSATIEKNAVETQVRAADVIKDSSIKENAALAQVAKQEAAGYQAVLSASQAAEAQNLAQQAQVAGDVKNQATEVLNQASDNVTVLGAELARQVEIVKDAQDVQHGADIAKSAAEVAEQQAVVNQEVIANELAKQLTIKEEASAVVRNATVTEEALKQEAAAKEAQAHANLKGAAHQVSRFESVKQHVLTYKKSYITGTAAVAAVSGYFFYKWYKDRQIKRAIARERVAQTLRTLFHQV